MRLSDKTIQVAQQATNEQVGMIAKEYQKTTLALASSMVMAGVYFVVGESTVPKDSNCNYLSPWTTDLMAWIFGVGVCYYGFKYEEPILVFLSVYPPDASPPKFPGTAGLFNVAIDPALLVTLTCPFGIEEREITELNCPPVTPVNCNVF